MVKEIEYFYVITLQDQNGHIASNQGTMIADINMKHFELYNHVRKKILELNPQFGEDNKHIICTNYFIRKN